MCVSVSVCVVQCRPWIKKLIVSYFCGKSLNYPTALGSKQTRGLQVEFQTRGTSLEHVCLFISNRKKSSSFISPTLCVVSMLTHSYDLLKLHNFSIFFSTSTKSLITCSCGRRPEERTVNRSGRHNNAESCLATGATTLDSISLECIAAVRGLSH